MAKHPCWTQGYVLQKTPDGVLLQCNLPDPSTGVYSDHMPAGATRIYGTFLVKNVPKQESLADNDGVWVVCYPCGTYSYTTVMGSQKTVAAYTAMLPGN